jgi:hypothetical protein
MWKADSRSACQTAFTEAECSLLCSQKPASGPYLSQPNPVRPIDSYLLKVHLNVILPPTPRSSQWSRPFEPSLRHACHMPYPPHTSWFKHPKNIRWRIQAMRFIIMQFTPRSVSLLDPNILNTLSQKTSVYVPPSKWEIKFRTHTAQLAPPLQLCIF